MELQKLFDQVIDFAQECGMKQKTRENSKGNTIVRDNATGRLNDKENSLKDAYFGFIREEEEHSGGYHDFSLVFFPQIDGKACVIALGVGSLGFANDYDIASLPWVRRLFSRLRKEGAKSYFKNDFSDIESPSSDLTKEIKENYSDLAKVIDKYKSVLPAAEILDFSNQNDDSKNMEIIKRWVATYAKMRNWADTYDKAETVINNLPIVEKEILDIDKIYEILSKDKYIVLQGAPGTGKTFSALEIAKRFKHVLFEQFHAETTFSDFIYGIIPVLNASNIAYAPKKGVLLNAIERANEKDGEKVLLIIDEINRANLSNVLGPVFYLFEKKQSNHNYSFQIGELKLDKLPDNLYVIATMNTADRSLAVVDFALRRRFTWLTLKPHIISTTQDDPILFQEGYFKDFDNIFQKYATDDELNLQPGQSYFIAENDDEMKKRLKYELMPLIKEYINEGYMTKAKDEFSNYFYNKLGVLMYE